MAAPKYLRVRNWDTFQHYKTGKNADAKPTWVKLYVSILDDWDLTSLPLAAQLLADRLLLVAARTGNEIRNDAKWIASATHIDFNYIDDALRELRRIGFVEPISSYSRPRRGLGQNRTEENRNPLPLSDSLDRPPLPDSVIAFRNGLKAVGE